MTSVRRLASNPTALLLLATVITACGGDSGGTDPGPSPLVPSSISVDPTAIVFDNVGLTRTIAAVVRDSGGAFGPETITIPMPIDGVYRYSVHDFTNLSSGTSTALSASGAKVQVFRDSQLISTLFPPAGAGTLWTVFELDGDDLTPMNQLSFNSSGGSTVNLLVGDETDEVVIHRAVSQAKKKR